MNRLLAERPLPRDGEEHNKNSDIAKGVGRRGSRRLARSVTVNLAESPLGWLKARGLVSARQYEAGETLRADFERARLAPLVTMRWGDPLPPAAKAGPPSPRDLSRAKLAARRRFEAAVAAAGSGLGDILWRVVCAGEGMRDAEAALNWPARAGRIVLALALDRLADHYRIR